MPSDAAPFPQDDPTPPREAMVRGKTAQLAQVLGPGQRARAVRVARGLLNSETRPAYVRAVRRRLGKAAGPADETPTAEAPVEGACLVCKAPVRDKTVSYGKKTFTVQQCLKCGYIANPDNFNDYTTYQSLSQFPVSARVGTPERPGREFEMARMGMQILGKKSVDSLIVGPGRSVDYRHIAKLPAAKRVAIGDVMQLHDVPDFVDLRHTRDTFDLVIACEVIEHFMDPANDFPGLFKLIGDDGLLVCSTNIYDGTNLNKHAYLFIKGHTSYYRPKTIATIAKKHGMLFDFRVPINATTFAGPRKRYVLFSRSVRRMQQVAQYFGDHTYAPSETSEK